MADHQIYVDREMLANHIGRCTRLTNVDVNNSLIRPCPTAKGNRGIRFTVGEVNRYLARKFPRLDTITSPHRDL
jgi:hypothetical protein